MISVNAKFSAIYSKVIITVIFNQTGIHLNISVFIDIIQRIIRSSDNSLLFYLAYKRTVNTEIKSIFLERRTVAKDLNSVCEISVVSEIIRLAVNFMKCHISGVTCNIVARTVIITCAFIIRMPCALGHTGFTKLVCDAIKRILACYCSTCPTEKAMPVFIYLYPSAGDRTKFRITPFSFYLNESGIFALILAVVAEVVISAIDCIDTGHFLAVYIVVITAPAIGDSDTVNICFAVSPYTVEQSVAAGALEHAVNNFIAMSCCGNGLAPVNYGIADFAVCSACVACFCAGRRFVGKCIRGVDMSAVPSSVICFALIGGNHILRHLVHLGVDLRTFTGECIGRTVDK